jgi:hypothetical protein
VLVLDANMLIRAVLGLRVLSLLETHAKSVAFITTRAAYVSIHLHLPGILRRRGYAQAAMERVLDEGSLTRLPGLVHSVPEDAFRSFREEAEKRIGKRDNDDWPYLALALTFNCPIWTEDRDFFATGVPTWTTDRIELFLSEDRV